jgi:serine acetyltransferase
MKSFKKQFIKLISIDTHISVMIKMSRALYFSVPILGRIISMFLDRIVLVLYGLDVSSFTINVKHLSISHPAGVLLGGNGITSPGRVVIMSGVKFGGRTPNNPEYLEKHAQKNVFELGDNVVVGSNSVILGPVKICDNVIVASMSLVNKSISEPGVYAGIPVKKVSSNVDDAWVSHLPNN